MMKIFVVAKWKLKVAEIAQTLKTAETSKKWQYAPCIMGHQYAALSLDHATEKPMQRSSTIVLLEMCQFRECGRHPNLCERPQA
jgi:hypothetical protein